MNRRIPTIMLGWLAVFAMLAGACGGVTSSAPDEGTVDVDFAAVAARTAEHGSIRIRMTLAMETSTFGLDTTVSAVMEGATDLATGNGELSFTSMEIDSPIPMPETADLTGTVVRVVDGVSYTSPPPVPVEAAWLATDAPPTTGMTMLPGTGTLDAQGVLDLLATLEDPHRVGPESVEGTDTTRWTASGRYGDFLEAAGVSLGELVGQFQLSMGTSYAQAGWEPPTEGELRVGIGTIPVTADVWVDGDGQLRQASFSMDMGQLFTLLLPPEAQAVAATMEMRMTMTATILGFGEPLQLVAPVDVVHLTQDQLLRAQIELAAPVAQPQGQELTPEQQDQVDSNRIVRLWVDAIEDHFGEVGSYPADADALLASTTLPATDLLEFVLDEDGLNYCLVTIGSGSIPTVRYATHGWGQSAFLTEFDVPTGECPALLASF